MRGTFIRTPFALSGDTNPIPVDAPVDGSVSFETGFGPDYELDQETDPNAKPVPRPESNWLYNVITDLLRYWQTETFPEFISPSDNGGVPFPYEVGAVVRWRATGGDPFVNYMNTTPNNVNLPNGAGWINFSATVASAVQRGGDTMAGALNLHAASTMPTAAAGDNDTTVANTQFVQVAVTTAARMLGAFNLRANLAAANASATFTADEVVVKAALGGNAYLLGAFNQTLNTGTVGAGGMDVGLAPVSGYVAVYAIYNPTTNTRQVLGVNASAAAAPEIYAGANMPAGYTHSELISVWPTTAARLLAPVTQIDRNITVASVQSNNFTAALLDTAVTLAVPHNAKTADISVQQTTTADASSYYFAAASSAPVNGGKATFTQALAHGVNTLRVFTSAGRVVLQTARTIYATWTVLGGASPNLGIAIAGYSF